MTRLERIGMLLDKAAREPTLRTAFLDDPVGIAAALGITLTHEEEGRASLLQADIWTGAAEGSTPIDQVFFGAQTHSAPPRTEAATDPYVRREPWRETR